MDSNAAKSSRRLHGFYAALSYGVCSATMAFANKVVMNTYGFNYPFTLMALQMVVSLAFIRSTLGGKVPPYTLERGRTFLVASVCSALHSSLSLIALEGMNIPMYSAVKRCTPLVNLLLSVVILDKPWPSGVIVFSVLLITFGCLVAGLGDLEFSGTAYAFALISVLVQGLYQTFVQKAAEKNLSVLDIFQLNCYNCLPMYLFGSFVAQEPSKIVGYAYLTDLEFLGCLLLVVVVGSLLNYTLFLSTSLNTALTTSLVGVVKSVLQTVVGFFTFGGVDVNAIIVTGISLNTVGGVLYTYGKLRTHSGQEKTVSDQTANEKLIRPEESPHAQSV